MEIKKSTKIIYWATTTLIFLFEGVMPALTSHTQMAADGVKHLGYPPYFVFLLMGFKVIGALALILPFVRPYMKEWAYAGFSIVMISACISHYMADGLDGRVFFPLIILAVLATSHIYFHKLLAAGYFRPRTAAAALSPEQALS